MSLELKLKRILEHIEAKPSPFNDVPYWRKLKEKLTRAMSIIMQDKCVLMDLWDITQHEDRGLSVIDILRDPARYYPFLEGQHDRIEKVKELGAELIEIAEEYFRTLRELKKRQLEYYNRVEAPWWDELGRLKGELPKPVQNLISFVYRVSRGADYVVIIREVCRAVLQAIRLYEEERGCEMSNL